MISIIVPVYNSEKTLSRCVKSLQAQTETELEILLVDDGSTDGSGDLCDAFAQADKRIQVIHKENNGVSSARNAGIRKAQGDYVQFVDSDDYVDPAYCRSMREALEQGGGRLAVCGYHHHYVGADVEKLPVREMDLLDLYGGGFLNMPWNKLFLREGLGLFPEDLSLGEDLLFNLEYLRWCLGEAGGGKKPSWLLLVEKPLHHYMQEESGQTLSSQKRADKLILAKRIRHESKRFFLEETQKCGGSVREDADKGNMEKLEEENFQSQEESGSYQGEKAWVERVRKVVDTRFLCECLDDIERLPFDHQQTGREKRAVIRGLCQDPQVREACCFGAPGPLDYQILQWTLGRGLVGSTYGLSVLRSLAVRGKRWLAGR